MTPGAALHVNTPNSTTTTSIFQAAASQTTRVTEWQDSSSAIMASVGPEGTISTTGNIHVYNTGYDIGAADYERLEINWDTNDATIATAAAGSGTLRDLKHYGQRVLTDAFDSAGLLKIYWRGNEKYRFETSALFPTVDGDNSLGKTGNRWATTYTYGISTNVETYTSGSVLLDDKNNVVLGDCSSGALTVDLQTAVGRRGLQYHIKKIDSTANVVTIDPSGTQTIDGQLSGVLSAQYNFLTIVSDNSNWFVIGSG
jgi:hypothetical protein